VVINRVLAPLTYEQNLGHDALNELHKKTFYDMTPW
jgi:hypothetical protein